MKFLREGLLPPVLFPYMKAKKLSYTKICAKMKFFREGLFLKQNLQKNRGASSVLCPH